MTTQDAYDAIYAYFHRKGAKVARSGPGGYCSYRVGQKPEGRGCAIGCLIPNDLYDPSLDDEQEGIDSNRAVRVLLRKLGYRSPKVLNFLGEAQNVHDCSKSVKAFRSSLDVLAEEYDLKVPTAA